MDTPAKRQPTGRPFAKGNPGRAKGSKNKRGLEIKALATRLMTDPEYLQMLALRLKAGKAPHMEVLLAHYAWGKPKEKIELDVVDIKALEIVVVKARDAGAFLGSNGHGQGNGSSNGHEPIEIDVAPGDEEPPE